MDVSKENSLKIEPKIENSWKSALEASFSQEYFLQLKAFLLSQQQQGKSFFPKSANIFNAFNKTPLEQVKVVILGQDPYHGEGQAHGLSFSVPEGVAIPPSLKNIFKELHHDLQLPIPKSGNLTKWAEQGVFLLNAILTVEAHKAASHQKQGWENFTDEVIHCVSNVREHVVFILWGKFAQSKAYLIDDKKHLILKSAHPSPLSAHNGFFGSKPFSKANQFLKENGIEEIDWNLNED